MTYEALPIEQVKHTPGPWMFRDAPDISHRMIFTEDGKAGIAKVIIHVRHPTVECRAESKANGILIAAAPSMMAALHKIDQLSFEHEEDAKWTWRDLYLEAAKIAREAIANATEPSPTAPEREGAGR